ncbi:MAG: polyprenyl synthetase family protein [Propionibacteriaceae bacterium]
MVTHAPQEVSEEFSQAVLDRLSEIEDDLVVSDQADTPFMTEAAQHIINAGGKRFRPALVVTAAHLGVDISRWEKDNDDLRKAALVMELTHVASLYHDDVIDDADTRRGVPAANRRWDNTVAILVGDYLFARASSLVAELGTEYVKLQADTFSRLVQGQVAEVRRPSADEDPLQHYLGVVADKTGSLIAASAVFGGMVAGHDEKVLAALSAFGEEIGVVFQLSDDIIDITSDSTGKTPGIDLREHVPTLPTLMLRDRVARGNGNDDDIALVAALDTDLADDARLATTLAALRSNTVIDEARQEIQRRAEVARQYLAELPQGDAALALSALCDSVVSRSF